MTGKVIGTVIAVFAVAAAVRHDDDDVVVVYWRNKKVRVGTLDLSTHSFSLLPTPPFIALSDAQKKCGILPKIKLLIHAPPCKLFYRRDKVLLAH